MNNETQPNTGGLHVVKAGAGEHWLIGGETTTVKISGRDTANGLLVLETAVALGKGLSNLSRHDFLETFCVLEGEVEFYTIDAQEKPLTICAARGDNVFVPPLAWHAYANVGSGPARLLTVFNTPVIKEFMHIIGQRTDDPARPPVPAPPSEETMGKVVALMHRNGIESMPLAELPT